MKILYLTQYFATPSSNAGTRHYETCKRLLRSGHKVKVITSSAYFLDKTIFQKGWNEIVIEGISLDVLHLPYSNKDSYFQRVIKFISFALKSTIKSFSKDFDLMYATSTPLTVAIPAIANKVFRNKKYVFEVRDLWPEMPIAVGALKNKFLIFLIKRFEILTYKLSSACVGLSPGMCDGIVSTGITDKKVFLAPNSCDYEFFQNVKENELKSICKKYNLSFTDKLIVYTGTIGIINDVEFMLKMAVESYQKRFNIKFVIIGEGIMKENIIEQAKNEGVYNKNFFIYPGIPKKELRCILKRADLALSLFKPIEAMWKNSANKFFDAIASSTPVAINYEGWQKDLIEMEKCGVILNPRDPADSSDRINDFLNNRADYEVATSSTVNLATGKFSRDNVFDRIHEAIRYAKEQT